MTDSFSYRFHTDEKVELTFSNGDTKFIRLSANSGKIVTRKKADTIFKVNHPGIYVGEEIDSGLSFILHNHYKVFGTTGVSPIEEYAAGQKVSWDNCTCINNNMTTLQRGLALASKGEPYHWLNNNCQVTVNEACNNERKSDVGKWLGRVAIGVLISVFVYAITKY